VSHDAGAACKMTYEIKACVLHLILDNLARAVLLVPEFRVRMQIAADRNNFLEFLRNQISNHGFRLGGGRHHHVEIVPASCTAMTAPGGGNIESSVMRGCIEENSG